MATFRRVLVTIHCANMAGAEEFCGRILGLRESCRFPMTGEPEHVEYSVGGTTPAIGSSAGLRAHGMPAATPGHPFEIGIDTDGVDAAVASLRAAGVRILHEPAVSPAGIVHAHVADPDGTWISLDQKAGR